MSGKSLFISSATVGPKGQIVIPKEVRAMFDIRPGDHLVVMADSTRGIAIHKQDVMEKLADAVFGGEGETVLPNETVSERTHFASAIRSVCEEETK